MRSIYGTIALCILLSFGCATTPKFAVTSDPVGADIFVDGECVGKTPATIKVKFKENAQMVMEKKILAVKLPGYKEKREVICSDGDPIKSLNFTLVSERVDSPASSATDKPTVATSPESAASTGVARAISAPMVEGGKSSVETVSTASAPTEQESKKSGAVVENKAEVVDQAVK